MSLTAYKDDAIVAFPKVLLRTADQYNLWKERVSACCWVTTRLDVFTLTDDECDAYTLEQEEKKGERDRLDKVGKCYLTIISLLSDDLFIKVAHVPKGKLASLIAEIRSALAVGSAEDINPLRVELYAVSMVRDCHSDLQSYIS